MKPIPESSRYGANVVPTRPWWRLPDPVPSVREEPGYSRADGVTFCPGHAVTKDKKSTHVPGTFYFGAKSAPAPEDKIGETVEAALAWFDHAEPMAPPDPAAGQVWTSGDDEFLVVAVVADRPIIAMPKYTMNQIIGYTLSPVANPPDGMWLKSGPGAPWSPR